LKEQGSEYPFFINYGENQLEEIEDNIFSVSEDKCNTFVFYYIGESNEKGEFLLKGGKKFDFRSLINLWVG